jgi:hypothetical protein
MSLVHCIVLGPSPTPQKSVPVGRAKTSPSAILEPPHATATSAEPPASDLSLFFALTNVLQREFIPCVTCDTRASPWQITVASCTERDVAVQCSAELNLPLSTFQVIVDTSQRTSLSFWLNNLAVAAAKAGPTCEATARLALYVLERSVLNGVFEMWDLCALDKVWRQRRSNDSADLRGPFMEIRVSVSEVNLAAAEAVVLAVNDVLHHAHLIISAVLGEERDLIGPFPSLSRGSALHVDAIWPASHPQYPTQSDAYLTELPTGVYAGQRSGVAAGTVPPQHLAVQVKLTDALAVEEETVCGGVFTLGAYVKFNSSVYTITAGHKLGSFVTNSYLDVPENKLVFMGAVNPPACSQTPTFFLADSADAIPYVARIVSATPAFAVDAVVRAHADVGVFLLDRPMSEEELNMVPVPVHTRHESLLITPDTFGPQFPYLGLVAYEDGAGPLLFAGCTHPGLLRTLHKVGVAKKRVELTRGSTGAAVVSWIFTDIAVHDGRPESGPCPANGDSGGPVMRAAALSADGHVAELESFICGIAHSGHGATLREYFVLTPAHLALAQLSELPVFTCPRGVVRPIVEFCQPRPLLSAVAAMAASTVTCCSGSLPATTAVV